MVALIAAMRKLISILNVMIKDGKTWNENYNLACSSRQSLRPAAVQTLEAI
jgi:hypothetical protein